MRLQGPSPGLVIITGGGHGIGAAGAPERIAQMAPSIPMRRAGMPDEVADAIIWLMSQKASYITGAILPVGGGR